ncbi:NUDIX domain-containing protein [Roseibium sp.]|uniref:NUDIX domain-containing protein n=1 Tax=Roseibium sp. TaxID=1936156 RepID=UPI00262102AC|nr:NUDIX domain-containing protein [Roseibium sp.]
MLPKQWTKRLVQGAGLVRNPYTLGVRVIVEDELKRVLLVHHSYLPGWYLPGGGVEGGETLDEAACREVREEAGIVADNNPTLLNMYLNEEATGRDHVGLFYLSAWQKADNFLKPNTEIVEAAFFALDALPADLSKATSRRLDEHRNGAFPAGGRW